MSTRAAILQPTYIGYVSTTEDALILFEACLSGHLSYVPRRLQSRERNSLIRNGCVFIYEEGASKIKRWTDGLTWSPSRTLGSFLIYRELDKPFPPGEKKRANKKTSRQPARPGEPYPRPNSTSEFYPTTPHPTNTPTQSGTERQLVGSLTDSYGFKRNGLMKKTMSATVQGVTYHLVSYYNKDSVSLLEQPSQACALSSITPRLDLTPKKRIPDPMEETMDAAWDRYQGCSNSYHPHSAYPTQPGVSVGCPPGPIGVNFMAPSQIPLYAELNLSPYNRAHKHSPKWHGSLGEFQCQWV
jgi:hypothetical protein